MSRVLPGRHPVSRGMTAALRTAGGGAAREVPPAGVQLPVYEGLGDVPPYDDDRDVEPPPPAVAGLRGAIRRADAVLFATPEYDRSIPGVLKNAVDWASRPYRRSVLAGKPVAVTGASTGRGGASRAQEDLRRVLESCDAEVLGWDLEVGRARERFEEGRLLDREVRRELGFLVARLAAVASGEAGERQTAAG